MDINTKINNGVAANTIANITKGALPENNILTLLYIADCNNTDFPFDSLPPLFFITDGGKNNKILVTEITGKSTRQLSIGRGIGRLQATLDLGEPAATKLVNTKTGDCFEHEDEIYLVVDRPEKAREKCIWAVPLSGEAGQTFENDWALEKVYRNPSLKIQAELK